MALYQRSLTTFVVLYLALATTLFPTPIALGQLQVTKGKTTQKTKDETKQKLEPLSKADSCTGSKLVLWEDRESIENLDLFYGSGGQAGAPNPAGNFTYIKDQVSGTQKKIIVKENRGASGW